jgi:NAD(P)-dependent dehydrogenase (short-subunit alcohol dehydrogenase family)
MFWWRRNGIRWPTRRLVTRVLGHGLCPVEMTARTTAPRKGHHVLIEAGQVAVVTGAAQGLGRALAAGLIDCGVSVVLADTATERLQTTAEEFTAHGGRALPVITDVSDAAAVDALAFRTFEHFGRVDMVVNNAGIGSGDGPLWQTDSQDWQRVVGVNLLGVVHGIQAFVPHMVRAGAGHVVNIASLSGLIAMPFAGAYCASKHAVVAISETLHSELEVMGLPIGVTVACPGLVRTPLAEGLFTLAQADDDVLAEHLPAHLSLEQLRARLNRMVADPLEPEVAAERILTAVEINRLYALTHGDFEDLVRRRVKGILAALDDQGRSDNHVGTVGDE